jgi:hypothetical protein
VKVQAAHEMGKRRVVIPAGQMTPELQTLEADLGIDVQEAADIGEAYQALTGRSLPVPRGYEDVPPEMSAAGVTMLQPLVEALHQRYQTEADALKEIPIPEEWQGLQQESWERFSRSRQALSRGELALAYSTAREATTRIRLLQNLLQAEASLAEFRDKPWDISVLTQNWEPVTADTEALLKDLEAMDVTTANEAISTSRAFGQLILALGLKNLALEEIDALKDSGTAEDPESDAYRRALFYLAIAPTLGADQVQTAQETLSLQAPGRGQRLDEREVAGFTNTLNTAAVAGIKAFEALTIQPIADSGATPFEMAAKDFQSRDASYFLALAALGSMDGLIEAMENQQNAVYARLGASQTAYLIASTLISKYYSLKASYDPELEALGIRSPVEFENQRGLINMLDLAERNARGTIAMAEGVGNDLTQQILMYEQAKLLREGTPADKVDALQLFWNASLESRLMTIFAGEFQLDGRSPSGWRWGVPVLGVGVAIAALVTGRYRHRAIAYLKRT